MFDVGFSELAVLAIIGLIVLGPERLPVVARTIGRLVGRAKGYMRTLSSELEREANVVEIRDEVRRAREQIESHARSAVDPVMQPLDPDERPGAQVDYSPAEEAAPPDADEGSSRSVGSEPGRDDGRSPVLPVNEHKDERQ